jgi:hypothetical protein
VQPWKNICCIVVTLAVLKPETSKDVRLEQLKNIYCIFVTLEVSNPETSKDVKPVQL